jgi:hypothetical protein
MPSVCKPRARLSSRTWVALRCQNDTTFANRYLDAYRLNCVPTERSKHLLQARRRPQATLKQICLFEAGAPNDAAQRPQRRSFIASTTYDPPRHKLIARSIFALHHEFHCLSTNRAQPIFNSIRIAERAGNILPAHEIRICQNDVYLGRGGVLTTPAVLAVSCHFSTILKSL